jgi:hypothetical protein
VVLTPTLGHYATRLGASTVPALAFVPAMNSTGVFWPKLLCGRCLYAPAGVPSQPHNGWPGGRGGRRAGGRGTRPAEATAGTAPCAQPYRGPQSGAPSAGGLSSTV